MKIRFTSSPVLAPNFRSTSESNRIKTRIEGARDVPPSAVAVQARSSRKPPASSQGWLMNLDFADLEIERFGCEVGSVSLSVFGISYHNTDQTASDCDEKLNSFTFSAGRSAALPPWPSELPTRSGLPIMSMLPGARSWVTLWLKRKFLTGYWILPFSMYQIPSRVNPVCNAVRGSTPRMYQKRPSSIPRSIDLIMSSSDTAGAELSMMLFTGPGVGSFPCRLAQ